MLKFLIFFSLAAFVVWGFFISLSIKRGIGLFSFSMKEKFHLLTIILIGVVLGSGIIFFEDREMSFSCSMESRICKYYRSTLYDKTMRLANFYDLSGIENVTIKPYSTRLTRYYKIRFEKPEAYFEIPERFDNQKEAERHLFEFRMLLKGKRSEYVYRKPFNPALEYASVILIGLVSLTLFALTGIGIILTYKNKPL